GKKVSNANYLWMSYFYSYLNDKGRAGVVMSSQASSAGLRIPTKPATHSNRKPATDSDLKPAGIPI
ncbi:MAG: hypothetical protein WAN02_04485, partial [Mycobacterium sp.]